VGGVWPASERYRGFWVAFLDSGSTDLGSGDEDSDWKGGGLGCEGGDLGSGRASPGFDSSDLGCLSWDMKRAREGAGSTTSVRAPPEWATRPSCSIAADRQSTVSEAPKFPASATRPSSLAAAYHQTSSQRQSPASSPTSKAVPQPRTSARAWKSHSRAVQSWI